MFRFPVLLIILTLAFSASAQKSKVQSFKVNEKVGVKSGKKVIISPDYSEIRIEENGLIAVKDTVGLWGYFDSKGNSITGPRFIDSKPFKKGRALVKKEDGWGVINSNGSFVLKPIYKKIDESDENVFKVTPFHEVIIFNTSKDTVATFLTDSITSVSQDIYAYFLDGKVGLLDKSGSKMNLPLYDSIGLFTGKLAPARKDNKWGVLDNFGKEIIPTSYDSLIIDSLNYIRTLSTTNSTPKWHLFNSEGKPSLAEPVDFIDEINSNSIFIYRDKEKSGLMNTKGETILEPVYDTIKRESNFYLIKSDKGQGLVTLDGSISYQAYADSINVLPNNHIIYCLGNNYHFLTIDGKEKYCSKNPLYALEDGLIEVRSGNSMNAVQKGNHIRKGRIDFNGKLVLEPVYDSISPFSKDSAVVVHKERQIGIYNFKRDTLIGPGDRIQEILPVSEGFYGVKIKGKWGFVDNLGRIRIANRYEGIGKFVEGYAPVKLLNKWGFVDKAEVLRVQPAFDEVQDFKNGVAIVKMNGKWGLINKKGQIITDFNFDGFERTIGNYYISFKKNNKNEVKKGLINPEGKEVIYAKYDDLKYLKDGNVIVKKNNLWGVVNSQDLILFSTVYKSIEFDEDKMNYIMIRDRRPEEIKI